MKVDFAIVGAGIAGATLAARLAAHGSVLLVERESAPGLHSTGRSAAIFIESYGPPQARALTRASRTALADAGVLSPRGVLYAAWQGQAALLDETMRTLAASGSAVHRIDADEALARVPVLRGDGLIGAIVEPGAADIDVAALHQQALVRARRLGAVSWTDAELLSAVDDGSQWTLRLSGDRTAVARVLVDAAGAWADTVAERAGLGAAGLQPKRRSAFTFDAPDGVDHRPWPAVVGIDEGWYIKPDAGQMLGSPANADPVVPHDVVAEEIDIATAIARIEEHTTLAIRRPRRTWAGLRTFAPDGELVIGADPRARGAPFFWLAGQGGYGIQSAIGAAMLAESLLLGAALPDQLRAEGVETAAMSPARLV